ncbi:MAG: hypothetical protein ACR2PR_06820 [Pseudohongiellaceae bacterium]
MTVLNYADIAAKDIAETAQATAAAMAISYRFYGHPLLTAEQQKARWQEQAQLLGIPVLEYLQSIKRDYNSSPQSFTCIMGGVMTVVHLPLEVAGAVLLHTLAGHKPKLGINAMCQFALLMQAGREGQLIHPAYYRVARELIEWERDIAKCP